MKAALYARYSTDQQSEASVDDQFRVAEQIAERNGYTVVDRFHDRAISGGTSKRAGYQAMLDAARRSEFVAIIAEDSSRLWRNMAEQAPRLAKLCDLGIQVVTHDLDTRSDSAAVLGAVTGIAAPLASTWEGQRDRVMFTTLYNTGARVSELIAMRVMDFQLSGSPAVLIHGKGRKERSVPLWSATAAHIRQWLRAHPRAPEDPIFPSRSGTALTRTRERLQLAARSAAATRPELAKRRITPHVWRHSLAMHLLQAGVDMTVIALWLGHESTSTTHMYVEADLTMKEKALKSIQAPRGAPPRYRPSDRVLRFLQTLS
jgi:integrase